MLIHKDTQSMKYSKDISRVYQLHVGKQQDCYSKKGRLGPVGLKREKTNYTNLPL